jgi:uncharacterized membrane protein
MGTASMIAERTNGTTAGRGGAPAPPGAVARRDRVNVSELERAASAVLGGVLIAEFLGRRRSAGAPALALIGAELVRRGVTGHCVAYQALGVGTARDGAARAGAAVQRSITIGRPAEELHRLWREPATVGHVFGAAAQVTSTGPDRMRWVVQGPGGRQAEWDTQTVEDRPGEVLRWASLPGAAVPNEGAVRFRPAPNDLGTEVTLALRFDPPSAGLGSALGALFGGAPGKLLATKVLHRFKSLAETGEVPTLTRQPAARNDGRDR